MSEEDAMGGCRTRVYIEVEEDEDGDVIVALHGVEHWHLAADGRTLGAALTLLASVVDAAEANQPDAVPLALRLGVEPVCTCNGGSQGEGLVSVPHEPHCPRWGRT